MKLNLARYPHFYYWIFPLVVVTTFVLFNHSGIPFLQHLISPPINREFGLVENLQLVMIALLVYVSYRGISSDKNLVENIGYGLLAAFFVVAFLEEIDYGIHYYEYFYNDGVEDKSITRNFHNQPGKLFYVRQFIIFTMVLVFVVLPLAKPYIKQPFLRHFCADRMIVYSFLVYLFISQLARRLPQFEVNVNPSLKGNHQEFEELTSYYIMFLYLYELVFLKGKLLAKNSFKVVSSG
ncbi:MAG: hypothetical protein AAF741_01430 [Bacteroidota bacterium]